MPNLDTPSPISNTSEVFYHELRPFLGIIIINSGLVYELNHHEYPTLEGNILSKIASRHIQDKETKYPDLTWDQYLTKKHSVVSIFLLQTKQGS